MLTALIRALGQVLDPQSRGVVWRGIIGAITGFIVLWLAVGAALAQLQLTGIGWVDTALDVLGGVAVLAVSWMLFPAVVIAISGVFVDAVVDRAEAMHFPGLPPPHHPGLRREIMVGLRLFSAAVLINMVVLPVYVFAPGLNLPLYFAVNGWLVSREYFELVAHRRLDIADAARARHRHSLAIFVAGTIMVAISTVPIVNLLMPVIAGAFFVHLFHGFMETEQSLGLRARQ